MTPSDSDLEAFLRFSEQLVVEAAGAILPRFGKADLAVERKSDATPVTMADREAEALMRKRIEARFPGHGIIGEEHGTVREDADYVWVLDPIDGTKSFISGVPLFTEFLWAMELLLVDRFDAGDHTIFLGEITDARKTGEGAPASTADYGKVYIGRQ